MTLSPTDINQIKAFISKRGFTQPDLQMEIIDHVACRIEKLMTDNSELSLSEAICLSHAEFGVMGFSVFEDAMRTALQKRYWHVFKRLYLANFTWKTVPLMAAFIYLVSIIFKAVNRPETLFTFSGFILMFGLIINGFVNANRYKKYTKMFTYKMGSVYLVISMVLFQLYNWFFIQLKIYQFLNADFTGLLFAGVMLLLLITFYTINKTQQHAVNTCKELEGKYMLMSA